MSRAEKDLIAVDRAGVERFVAFGSDIPRGWKVVRESEPAVVPASATAPRTIGNVDAAADRAERLAGDAERQADAAALSRERLVAADLPYSDRKVEDLQAEANRLGLEVEGTGKDGNVLKDDLVAALEAHDGVARNA